MYTIYSDNRYKRKEKKGAKVIIFKEECMQAQTPRKESTMARRFLETSHTSSQKGKKGHFSPTRKQSSNSHRSLSSSRSLSSPLSRKTPSLPESYSSHAHHLSEMPTIITTALRNWLTKNGLQGFIKVAEAPPHPNATEIASKLNIETIIDSMLRKKLSLDSTGERQLEMVPSEILERYYGK